MLKVFEAFAGIGCQRISLNRIGIDYEVVGICEIDKYAIKSYEALHGKVNNLGDISKVKAKDIPAHDLLIYSFPCQDISVAGHQASLAEGSGTRSSLIWECKKIIENCKPKYLIMENVKNLVSKKHKPNFDKWLSYLESLGYKNYWKVLDAKDYNLPQSRQRVFAISILGEHELYEFPKPLKLTKKLSDILEADVDKKYYLSDVAINKMKKYEPKNIKDKNISPCLTTELAHGTGKNFHPKFCKLIGEYRKPTTLEIFRLMGFTDEEFYKLKEVNSDTKLYEQAGNGIAVNVLEEVLKKLFYNIGICTEKQKTLNTEYDQLKWII